MEDRRQAILKSISEQGKLTDELAGAINATLGKTTLLRLLTGLARPDGGEVYWQGEPLRRVRDSFHSGLLWIG
ncbi:hypothetical protein MJL79_30085, partial [Salmonella enterica subsp. enterica serovar Montevideo]|nr:hypothetical protein [Salmonella enterica subsp. enterica serovar Montevideo]